MNNVKRLIEAEQACLKCQAEREEQYCELIVRRMAQESLLLV